VVSPEPVAPRDGDRDLVVPLVKGGELLDPAGPAELLERARAHYDEVRQALPPEAWALSRGEPVLDTVTV
jgi:nicotinate phosphoribosyltransferase